MAKLTVRTLTQLLTRWAYEVHNRRRLDDKWCRPDWIARGVSMSPNGLWAADALALPAYEVEVYLPRMLERNRATVTRRGLEFGGLVFDRPDDTVFARMKSEAAGPGGHSPIAIHFDRMITRQIYIASRRLSDPVIPVPRSRINREWENYSFPDIELALKTAAEKGQVTGNEYLQAKIDYSILVDEALSAAADAISAKYLDTKIPIDLKEVARADQQKRQLEEESKLLPNPTVTPCPGASPTDVVSAAPSEAATAAAAKPGYPATSSTPPPVAAAPASPGAPAPSPTPPPPAKKSVLPEY